MITVRQDAVRTQGRAPKGGGDRNPGGSLEATRRSFNKDFLLALAADFKKHGAAAIEKVRKTQPAAYMKICALLVPREMKAEHAGGVKAMTEEQIVDAIAANAQTPIGSAAANSGFVATRFSFSF